MTLWLPVSEAGFTLVASCVYVLVQDARCCVTRPQQWFCCLVRPCYVCTDNALHPAPSDEVEATLAPGGLTTLMWIELSIDGCLSVCGLGLEECQGWGTLALDSGG